MSVVNTSFTRSAERELHRLISARNVRSFLSNDAGPAITVSAKENIVAEFAESGGKP